MIPSDSEVVTEFRAFVERESFPCLGARGLSPVSSRLARQFAWPALVFNPHAVPTTFNVFMNVEVRDSGEIAILPPRSRSGDYLVLRAEMDMIVGITACSAELSNNGGFTPIDIEVMPNPAAGAANAAALPRA